MGTTSQVKLTKIRIADKLEEKAAIIARIVLPAIDHPETKHLTEKLTNKTAIIIMGTIKTTISDNVIGDKKI